MKHYRIMFVMCLLLLNVTTAVCQELTQSQKESLQARVKNKVEEFQYYLKQLADKQSTSYEMKNEAYRLAVKLFIGECEDYNIREYNKETRSYEQIYQKAVRMEITSKYKPPKSSRMKGYFNSLRYNKTADQIEITEADAVRVDNIYRVGDHYECMAYFCQKYISYRDNRILYGDITTKKVKVIIQAIEVPTSSGAENGRYPFT